MPGTTDHGSTPLLTSPSPRAPWHTALEGGAQCELVWGTPARHPLLRAALGHHPAVLHGHVTLSMSLVLHSHSTDTVGTCEAGELHVAFSPAWGLSRCAVAPALTPAGKVT